MLRNGFVKELLSTNKSNTKKLNQLQNEFNKNYHIFKTGETVYYIDEYTGNIEKGAYIQSVSKFFSAIEIDVLGVAITKNIFTMYLRLTEEEMIKQLNEYIEYQQGKHNVNTKDDLIKLMYDKLFNQSECVDYVLKIFVDKKISEMEIKDEYFR